MSSNDMELTFYNDLMNQNDYMENPLCGLTRGQKDTFCRAAFAMPRFKVTIQAMFNKQAFFEREPQCSNRGLHFRSLDFIDHWMQDIFPCFGRHTVPRTSWEEDPFFDTFYFVLSRPESIVYVLAEERSGEKDEIHIIDIVRLKIDPFSLAESVVTYEEKTEEEYLNAIEVHSNNIRIVETIFVRDIIRNEVHFTDPFATMEAGKMLTVCLSIFTEIRYTMQGIVIDRQGMLTQPYGALPRTVYFFHEEQQDGHPQITYPCRAFHDSMSTTKSLAVKDRYSIAAGRKERSIFIFEMFDYSDNVRPTGYIENFDFENLLPSELSETEIYQIMEQLPRENI